MRNERFACGKIGKSRQPWVIFQFPFFFPEDNKVLKNEYSSIAADYCSLAQL